LEKSIQPLNGRTFGNEHGHRHHQTMTNKHISEQGLIICVMQFYSTYLLGLAATGIGNKESTVELDKDFLDFLLGGLIDELLVEGNDSLGKSLTDGVDLRNVTLRRDKLI
jgi:hypothetical protein